MLTITGSLLSGFWLCFDQSCSGLNLLAALKINTMHLEGSPRTTGAYLGSQSHQLTALKQTPTRDQLRDPECYPYIVQERSSKRQP
jgi:hypothetical protein